MADSHYLNGISYIHMNQVKKMLRALMTFAEMYRSWVFLRLGP